MNTLNDLAGPISRWLLETSLHLSAIILVVLAIHALLGRRLAPSWRLALWGVVVLRLILPGGWQSRWSVMNLLPASESPITTASDAQTITVHYGPAPVNARPTKSTDIVERNVASPSSAANHPIPWRLLMVGIWAIGAAVLLGRLFVIDLRLRRLLNNLPTATDPRLLAALSAACSRARVREPRVVESSYAHSPAIAGLFSPVLIVPKQIADWLDPAQLNLVLLHEMTHIRRADLLWRWIAAIAVALQWCNPMIWLACRRFLADCELACDEAVLKSADAPARRSYGDALLDIAQWSTRAPLAGAIGVLGRSSLSNRIRAVVNPTKRWSLAGPVALLIAGCSTMTAPKSPTTSMSPIPHEPGDTVVHVYDIRDLVIEIPDFTPDSTGFSAQGRAMPTTAPAGASVAPWAIGSNKALPATTQSPETANRLKLADDVIKLIQDTIDPDSWKDRGGSTGSIRQLSGQLIVTQTLHNQDLVGSLLNQLRECRAIQISVESRFLRGDAVTKQILDILNSREGAPKPPAKPGQQEAAGVLYLDEAQAQAIVNLAKVDTASTTMSAPRITLFNGQRGYVNVSSSRAYVAAIRPLIGDNGAKGFDPEVRTIDSGIIFDCQATASADRKYVTLTLRPRVSNLLSLDAVPFPEAHADPVAMIQVPKVEIARYESTISVPDKATLAILLHPEITPASENDHARPVVLLVKPTLIVQREQEAK